MCGTSRKGWYSDGTTARGGPGLSEINLPPALASQHHMVIIMMIMIVVVVVVVIIIVMMIMIIIMIMIVIVIIIMSALLECLPCETCSTGLNKYKYKNIKHMHIGHLKQHVSKKSACPCPLSVL